METSISSRPINSSQTPLQQRYFTPSKTSRPTTLRRKNNFISTLYALSPQTTKAELGRATLGSYCLLLSNKKQTYKPRKSWGASRNGWKSSNFHSGHFRVKSSITLSPTWFESFEKRRNCREKAECKDKRVIKAKMDKGQNNWQRANMGKFKATAPTKCTAARKSIK